MVAESYERIHRSNLVGMGILPLQYKPGESAATLGLTGREVYTINLPQDLKPGQDLTVQVCINNSLIQVFIIPLVSIVSVMLLLWIAYSVYTDHTH